MGHYDSARDYDYEQERQGLITRITEELENKSKSELYAIESIVHNIDAFRKTFQTINKL